MTLHVAAILSGFAYLGLCLLAAGAAESVFAITQSDRNDHRPGMSGVLGQPGLTGRSCLSVLFGLAAFLCIPPGSLPALASVSWSGPAALLCLVVSLSLDPGWKMQHAARLSVPLRLGLALAACAWYARQRGVPGDLLVLDTYAAMPLLGVAEGLAWGSLMLLALVALPLPGGCFQITLLSNYSVIQPHLLRSRTIRVHSLRKKVWIPRPWSKIVHLKTAPSLALPSTGLSTLAGNLRHLASLGIWVCLFLPMGLAHATGLTGLAGLAVDFVYFWGKMLMLRYVLGLAVALALKRPRR